LFVIARSKNANIVRYDARLADDGSLRSDDPIIAYWVLAAEDGRRQPLSWFERRVAYGYSVSDRRKDGCTLRLSAFETRPLTVARDPSGQFRVRTVIARRPAILKRVFVVTDEGALIPSVRYLDLEGFDARTAKALVERVEP
jgi:hypothetical protein